MRTAHLIYDDFDEPGGILRVYHWCGGELRVHLRFARAVAFDSDDGPHPDYGLTDDDYRGQMW